ncbi:hypothetical protein C4D60_Mb04t30990 [Musa balbisiana]|uniref:Uncharacterized protein n=1 Tax=Musa balbisiana TaxID=52838 RepID=A0A4S8KFW5_MUSBA|nr:hypothetical protein C4D60_Mb04t30990 [Musa balbisiana]
MGRSAGRMQFPEGADPAIRSAITITSRLAHHHGGRRCRSAAPILWWKLHDAVRSVKTPEQAGARGKSHQEKECEVGKPEGAFSARNLAAALWHLQQVAGVKGSGRRGRGGRLGFKLESWGKFHNFALERATKWDVGCLVSVHESCHNHGHQKLVNTRLNTVSVISSLWEELEQAHLYLDEHQNERQSAKQKLCCFMRKPWEEKASWQISEHEKVRDIIAAIKDDLNRERRSGKRMEIMNSKLVSELAEAKLSAKQYLQNYEKERKERELIQEVCNKLAKEIGDNKAEVESLKRESTKLREELDEERNMLQMAKVWREERVQMKLVDTKLMLEEKHSELIKLQADLDAFLRGHASTRANTSVQKADVLREAGFG